MASSSQPGEQPGPDLAILYTSVLSELGENKVWHYGFQCHQADAELSSLACACAFPLVDILHWMKK